MPLLLMLASITQQNIVNIQAILRVNMTRPQDFIWYLPAYFLKINVDIVIRSNVTSFKIITDNKRLKDLLVGNDGMFLVYSSALVTENV